MTEANNEPQVAKAAEKVVDQAAGATKTAAKAPKAKNDDSPAPDRRTGKPKAYTSTSPTYVGGELVRAGEVFVTDDPKGGDWHEVAAKEAAAIEAATNLVPDDAQFDEASVEALQAYALFKHVPIVGIAKDRKALITAIKAANEPKL